MKKLNNGHKNILRLIHRDCDEDGWTPVSEQLMKFLPKYMPVELVVFEKLEKGGRAKLTDEGRSVINSMKWLG